MPTFATWAKHDTVRMTRLEHRIRSHLDPGPPLHNADRRRLRTAAKGPRRVVATLADVSITNLNRDPHLAAQRLTALAEALDQPRLQPDAWAACFPRRRWPTQPAFTAGREPLAGVFHLFRTEAIGLHHDQLTTNLGPAFEELIARANLRRLRAVASTPAAIAERLRLLAQHGSQDDLQRCCATWLDDLRSKVGYVWAAEWSRTAAHHGHPAAANLAALLEHVPMKRVLDAIGLEDRGETRVAFHMRVRSPERFVVLRPSWGEAPMHSLFAVNPRARATHGRALDLATFKPHVAEYVVWPAQKRTICENVSARSVAHFGKRLTLFSFDCV